MSDVCLDCLVASCFFMVMERGLDASGTCVSGFELDHECG